MDHNNLCPGCFSDKGSQNPCRSCGYEEKTLDVSIYLPSRTILAEKYIIGKVLGQGGFGITYLGWDINLDMKLAVKEFFPQGMVSRLPGQNKVISFPGAEDSSFDFWLERFLREAKTLAQFEHHPNIVSVRDFFKANNTAYMIMSYIEGLTLGQYLVEAGGKLSYGKAIEVMMPVMDALRGVHEAGIMHRDISPDNIFIENKGRVVLIDFGAARHEVSDKSKSLSVILKAGYAPPEQYQSRGKQGPWTDIYAVAATIYRAITGQTPLEAVDRLTGDDLVLPSELGVEIEPDQEQVLLKALAVKAGERYQAVEEFQRELAALFDKNQVYVDDYNGYVLTNNGQATITFPDGAKYVGELKDGKPYGKGTYTWPVGQKYIGEFKKGQPHGQGVMTFPVGQKYEGEFKDGQKHGQGKHTWPDGEKYEGEFKDDKRNGQGIIAYPDDEKYEGEWKDDKPNGQGTYTWSNGKKYVGEFKDSQKHGQGIIVSPDGKKYEGEWKDDKPNGQGIMTLAGGEQYEGEWKDGQRNGQGITTYPDGKKYEGEWKDGHRNGQGTITWPDGEKYEGEFKDDKRNGQGIMTDPDGAQYEGEWKDDKPNGQGIMVYSDGKKYEGEWKDGQRNGQGTITWPSGLKYEGEWKDDKLNGQGIMTYPSGTVEKGKWERNEFLGL